MFLAVLTLNSIVSAIMLIMQFAMQLPMLAPAQPFLMGIGMFVLQPFMLIVMPIFEPIMFTGMAIILVVSRRRYGKPCNRYAAQQNHRPFAHDKVLLFL